MEVLLLMLGSKGQNVLQEWRHDLMIMQHLFHHCQSNPQPVARMWRMYESMMAVVIGTKCTDSDYLTYMKRHFGSENELVDFGSRCSFRLSESVMPLDTNLAVFPRVSRASMQSSGPLTGPVCISLAKIYVCFILAIKYLLRAS